jgi:hypothetical protein
MRRLDSRLRRLEGVSRRSVQGLSDAELHREIAGILARLFRQSVDEVEALLPTWQRDGTLATLAAELEASLAQ